MLLRELGTFIQPKVTDLCRLCPIVSEIAGKNVLLIMV